MMERIRTTDELDDALAMDRALIYKHSTRCELSAVAEREIQAFVENFPDAAVYVIDVIADRMISDTIESRLQIRHESPQAILVEAGDVVMHASHRGISEATLEGWWADSTTGD